MPGDPKLADRSTATCYSCHGDTERDSHPVGVAYDSVSRWSRAALRPSFTKTPFGSTIEKDLLVAGRVECVTCHVTHSEESENAPRLRVPRSDVVSGHARPGYTALCMSCHDIDGR